MKLSKATLINSGLAVVVVGGIAAALVVTQPFSSTATQETTQLTGTVQQGAVTSTITASGSVAAVREVAASFAASGTIATVDVVLGQTVEAGQQLGTLDTADLSSAVSAAYTTLSRAKSDLASATTSLAEARASAAAAATAVSDPAASTGGASSSGGTSNSGGTSVSQAQSAVNSASDKVTDATTAAAAAENALANATLAAPISGLVVAVNGSVGASTGSGSSASGASGVGGASSSTASTSTFVTIADVSQYTMSASIAEADIASVTVGQTADISFPALDDVTTTATVTAISPAATASNSVVTFATTLTLDSIPDGLRIGQTASATITTVSSGEDSLYVPTAAITTATDGTSTVDVVGDDDDVTTVTVELGIVGDQGTEIVSGLEAGQTVMLGTVTPTDSSGTDSTQMNGGFGGGVQMPSGGFPSGEMPSGGGFPSQ